MNREKAFQDKIEAQLKEWSAEIEKMKAKADKLEAEARLEYQQQIRSLGEKQQAVQSRLQTMMEAGEERWDRLKTDVEVAFNAFAKEFQRVKDTLRRDTDRTSIGWPEGIATERPDDSAGWAEGFTTERPDDSKGWAEGLATKEPEIDSEGWSEGYRQKKS